MTLRITVQNRSMGLRLQGYKRNHAPKERGLHMAFPFRAQPTCGRVPSADYLGLAARLHRTIDGSDIFRARG